MPNTAVDKHSFGHTVHVAVGVVLNADRVLVAKRPAGKDFAGYWEFPGGKMHTGEEARAALSRELQEELGLQVLHCRPLITIKHRYPHKTVILHTFVVDSFTGEAHGREGQRIKWLDVQALRADRFPGANVPIIHALRLPHRYLVTPEPSPDFLQKLERALQQGFNWICLRAKSLSVQDYLRHARRALEVCDRYHARVMLHRHESLLHALPVAGVHLTSAQLHAWKAYPQPLEPGYCYAASCHDGSELGMAESMGCRFAVLSPVLRPRSHLSAWPAMGWEQFQRLTEQASIPVYALGGLQESDLDTAWEHGAQGVAAISAFWPS